ncbi:MAG TPA: hypothetical protein VGI31_11805 [Streptosporangiaceae bacterium]
MTRRTRAIAITALVALGVAAASYAGLRPALAQGRSWTTQVTLSDLRSVTCAGTSDCWAVGSNSTAPVVYHTTNGGTSWTIQTVANPIGYLQSVYCQSDGLHCWAAGTAEAGTGAAGVIYSTINGGTNWSGARVTSAASRLNSIACPGSGTAVTCIVVGDTEAAPFSGRVLLVPGDLSSVQSVALPSGVADLTGVACQGSSDCVATGVRSTDQTTGVFSGTLIATANGGTSWTTTQIPADVSGLAGVTCPSSGSCAAVGYSAPSGGPPGAVVINGPVTATSWSAEAHITGVDYLDGIACPAPATCLAAGYSGTGAAATAKLAWTTSGSSWSTEAVGPGYLDGVACPAAGTCWTAGYQALGASGSGDIDALTLSGSTWTVHSQLSLGPRVGLTGVSCANQTNCIAVGNSASGPVILASADGATWKSQTPPAKPGVVYHLDAVACPSTTQCVAVGYEVQSSGVKTAISTSTSNGGTTWSPVTVLSGVSHLDGVTCASTARCWAGGVDITSLGTSGFTGVIDTTTNFGSTWAPTTVPATVGYVTGVACAPGSTTCAAVGGTPAGVPTVVTTTTGMTWTARTLPTLPNGGSYSDLNAVSCAATTSCEAVGDQLVLASGTAQGQAVILSGSGTGLGTWSLQTAPSGTGPLRSVSCATATTCEAVGTTISPEVGSPPEPTGPTTTALSTNDGSTWAVDTLPNDVPVLRAVACATGTSACRAVGSSSIVAAGS